MKTNVKKYFRNKTLIHFVFFLLGLLFIVSFYQHCAVNFELNQRYNCALKNIEETESDMQKQLKADEINLPQLKEFIHSHKYQTKDALLKINDLKQSVFDSNAITFLVCAIIVLLSGILTGIMFNIDKRANVKIKEMSDFERNIAEKIKDMEEIKIFNEKERNTSRLLIKLQSLKSLSFSFQQIISVSYTVNATINTIINQMFKFIYENEKSIFTDNSQYRITKEIKDNIYKIFLDAKDAIPIEKIIATPANKEKTKHIKELVELLDEFLEKIEDMKTVD